MHAFIHEESGRKRLVHLGSISIPQGKYSHIFPLSLSPILLQLLNGIAAIDRLTSLRFPLRFGFAIVISLSPLYIIFNTLIYLLLPPPPTIIVDIEQYVEMVTALSLFPPHRKSTAIR